jgi:Ca-activated chloride channel family protein
MSPQSGRAHPLSWLLAVLALFLVGVDARADSDGTAPPARSPYFEVHDDSGVDHFPMKETRVSVRLDGVIASVHVHQVYRNEGKTPLNAKYVFPGSTRAAVNSMVMTIGTRRLRAQIREREQAHRLFEAAKAAGQTASLLAQQRPNVFSMEVANIAVGASVDVELEYTEFLEANDGEYEFVYPGAVGPRYGGDAARSDQPTAWISNPYLHTGEAAPSAFDISVTLESPLPLHDVQSASHRIVAQWRGPKSVSIGLDEPRITAGNRDFILHYRLQDNAIVSGLTRFSAGGENYFMLQAEPPQRVVPAVLPARDYVFILDVSGSMAGFPLDTARTLIERLLASLQPQDSFNILFFAGDSATLAPQSLRATPANLARAREMLARISGGGGTELLPALQQALAMPLAEGTSRSLVLITDGYVSAEGNAFKLVDDNLGKANLYAFGIGSSVNRFLIEGLAKVGHAESFVVTDAAAAAREAERFRAYISAPVLTSIVVAGKGVEIYDTEPRAQPDLLARRPLLVIGKYRDAGAAASIELSGASGAGTQQWSFPLARTDTDAALPILWARKRLERLYVFPHASDDARAEILALGLKYSLLTSATSFVGVDEALPTGDGPTASDVKQPLPLPQGVSDAAVGESLTPAPEPEWPVLVAWCALLLGLRCARKLYRVRTGG